MLWHKNQGAGGLVTAPVGGGPTLNFIGTSDDGGNGPAYTFSNVDIGTASSDRLVVVACHATGNTGALNINLTSMTLGGSSMTNAAAFAEDTASVDLYYLTVTSGTTATIVATYPNQKRRCTIAVYTITGLNSSTPSDTGTSSNSDSAPTLTLDIPTGSIAVYAHTSASGSTTTVTYSSATEHYDQNIGGETTTASGASLADAGNAHTETATLADTKERTVLIGAVWS
jgi:hypothetical protein